MRLTSWTLIATGALLIFVGSVNPVGSSARSKVRVKSIPTRGPLRQLGTRFFVAELRDPEIDATRVPGARRAPSDA